MEPEKKEDSMDEILSKYIQLVKELKLKNTLLERKIEDSKRSFSLSSFKEICNFYSLLLKYSSLDQETLFLEYSVICSTFLKLLSEFGFSLIPLEKTYNPETHEICERVLSKKEEEHMKVKEVLSRGYFYKDSVFVKEKVSLFIFEKNN